MAEVGKLRWNWMGVAFSRCSCSFGLLVRSGLIPPRNETKVVSTLALVAEVARFDFNEVSREAALFDQVKTFVILHASLCLHS